MFQSSIQPLTCSYTTYVRMGPGYSSGCFRRRSAEMMMRRALKRWGRESEKSRISTAAYCGLLTWRLSLASTIKLQTKDIVCEVIKLKLVFSSVSVSELLSSLMTSHPVLTIPSANDG